MNRFVWWALLLKCGDCGAGAALISRGGVMALDVGVTGQQFCDCSSQSAGAVAVDYADCFGS